MTDLAYIDVLPRPSGQRVADAHRALARQHAARAWDEYQTLRAVQVEARQSVQMAARDARLRPVERTGHHLVRGRLVPVTIRREFPYGPAIDTVVPEMSRFDRMKAAVKQAILSALTAKAVAGTSTEKDGPPPSPFVGGYRGGGKTKTQEAFVRQQLEDQGGHHGA